jgi:ABC-2 type transport system ATP-binding protein
VRRESPLLSVEDLTQTAPGAGRRGRPILRALSFALGPGVTALIGPNGAGKSTLMRALAGAVVPAAGRVAWQGEAWSTAERRRHVAYVPQFPGLYPELTPRQFLTRIRLWTEVAEDLAGASRAATEALARWGLEEAADRPTAALAPADRRRLALAGAWVRGCPLILLDEPTSGLDPLERAAFWTLVARLVADAPPPTAVVVTTHDLDEVDAYCDGAVVVAGGRAHFAGPVEAHAAQAAGRAWRVREAALGPALVGVRPAGDGWLDVLALPGATVPAAGRARQPTALDGYLTLAPAWEAASTAQSADGDGHAR